MPDLPEPGTESDPVRRRIVSVNLGTPRELTWRGRTLTTAIFKEPVAGPVALAPLGLAGDAQADLRVHGGPDKAVYLYPEEHYRHWAGVLDRPLEPGALGENLTTRGLLESELAVGDTVRAGSALLQVSEPRLPCVKLAARYGRPDLPELFVQARRPGIYFRVLEEGAVAAGDALAVMERAPERWTIAQVAALVSGLEEDGPASVRLAGHPLLGTGARGNLRKRTGFSGRMDDASDGDVDALRRLLTAAGLPAEGFPQDTPVVLAARDEDGGLLGGVALEIREDVALLRSAVVAPDARGRGLGGALVRAAMERAWGAGLRSVSLLTETAEGFFPRFGFRPARRQDLPPALWASAELQGACPDSAAVMTLPAPASPRRT